MYGMMIAVPDGYYLLYKAGIINKWLYHWHVRGAGARIRSAVVAFALVALLLIGIAYSYPGHDLTLETYDLWRLGKTNSTKLDQYRTRRDLVAIMGNPLIARRATSDIVALIRRPELPVDRIDLALQILLEDRNANPGRSDLAILLVPGLRAESVDVRSRVNEALKYLALACTPQLDAALRDWKPSDGDPTTALESIIKQWDQFAREDKC